MRFLYRTANLVFDRDIASQWKTPLPDGFNSIRCPPSSVEIDVDANDIGTCACIRERNFNAQAGTGSSDDSHLIGETEKPRMFQRKSFRMLDRFAV
jgi:hypothetical protein